MQPIRRRIAHVQAAFQSVSLLRGRIRTHFNLICVSFIRGHRAELTGNERITVGWRWMEHDYKGYSRQIQTLVYVL